MIRCVGFAITGILAAVALAAGSLEMKNQAPARKEETRTKPPITPEQARAALLKLNIRVLTGKEDDPVWVNLRDGLIVRTGATKVKIGDFCSCDLDKGTWDVGFAIETEPTFHFGANGRFERQTDGTWRAIQTGGHIT